MGKEEDSLTEGVKSKSVGENLLVPSLPFVWTLFWCLCCFVCWVGLCFFYCFSCFASAWRCSCQQRLRVLHVNRELFVTGRLSITTGQISRLCCLHWPKHSKLWLDAPLSGMDCQVQDIYNRSLGLEERFYTPRQRQPALSVHGQWAGALTP